MLFLQNDIKMCTVEKVQRFVSIMAVTFDTLDVSSM